MALAQLVARVDAKEEDAYVVRSPAVGVADGVPALGRFLNAQEGFLSLKILNRRYVVQLPRGIQGRVVERFIDDTVTPLSYGQPLLRLSLAAADVAAEQAARSPTGAGAGPDADLIAVESPSEGVFYCRPSPDSPPYVDQGDLVTVGSVVGLVEVMKCFNPIRYGAPGLPERGTVAKVLVEDATEVTFGQPLLLIRPAE